MNSSVKVKLVYCTAYFVKIKVAKKENRCAVPFSAKGLQNQMALLMPMVLFNPLYTPSSFTMSVSTASTSLRFV